MNKAKPYSGDNFFRADAVHIFNPNRTVLFNNQRMILLFFRILFFKGSLVITPLL